MTTQDSSKAVGYSISSYWQPLTYMLAEVAACFPILVLLDGYLFHTDQPVLWALWLLCAGGLGITLRIAVRRFAVQWKTISWSVVWIIIGALVCWMILNHVSWTSIWIASISLLVVGLFRGNMLVMGDWDRLFPLTLQLILLIVAWIFYVITGSSGDLSSAHFSIYIAGMIHLFAILMRCGARQINYSVWEDGFPIAALQLVIRRSRRWTWILIGVIAIIGGSTQLSMMLSWLWQKILSLFQSNETVIPSQMIEPMNPPPLLPPMDLPEQSPSILDPAWIERIAQIIMIAALAAFMIGVGLFIYRLIRKYGPPLWRWLLRILGIESAIPLPAEEPSVGYVDQTEKIHSKPSPFRIPLKRKVPDDPAERVRYHYEKLIRRGLKHGLDQHQGDTPTILGRKMIHLNKKETSMDSEQRISVLIRWYNQIRYGAKSIDAEELKVWEKKD
ncbi:hypothetical protein PTI45_01843 [Paenibacillus nuruki]|uniref:DUF4129 domain-containing protein n=1 Tax=Paenibacillus nuruki TaxID=1886670 RepID=A0A1E3L4W4_9BACL|nr:DUF4129 domain-containing protein [Paenibacillus nuruki]ODP28867.1 hypothetical protein PTI45_01843 [Paenibacillus nuruki]